MDNITSLLWYNLLIEVFLIYIEDSTKEKLNAKVTEQQYYHGIPLI